MTYAKVDSFEAAYEEAPVTTWAVIVGLASLPLMVVVFWAWVGYKLLAHVVQWVGF